MTKEVVLPSDLAACHAIIREQAQQLEDQKARIAKAEAERDAALQLAFRKKMERYLPDPKQFVLDFGDSPEVVDAAEGIAVSAHHRHVPRGADGGDLRLVSPFSPCVAGRA